MYSWFWSQYDGNKKAVEQASILWQFLSLPVAAGKKYLIHWADNCAAQNKCWIKIWFVGWLILSGRLTRADLKNVKKGTLLMELRIVCLID